MPKTDTPAAAALEPIPAAETRALRLGDQVQVQAPAGTTHLRNLESGGFFAPGVPTPQTVTVTLLRRLSDGDLTLV